nr:alpha-dioxygenase 1 [Quercus suber]
MQIVHSIDKSGIWPRLPVIFGILYLAIRRHLHNEYNLFNVGTSRVGVRFNPVDHPFRTADGEFNDPFNEGAGSEGSFFGRNVLPVDQKDKLLKPDPVVVATKLLARRKFKDTGKQFNMIAASWIQFMIHDWIDHLEDTKQIELTAPKEVANQCPLKSFKFYKTKEVPTGFYEIQTGALNIRTPWWDGSVIYGSNAETLQKVRTFKDGKLKISSIGLLLHDQDGIAVSGDVRNSWIGVSTLQALFIKEHNAVCDSLKKEYPHLDDEELYRHARLVTSAVIAKIHTIDWTVELLKTDTMIAGMRNNWYGLLGKKFKDTFGHVGGAIFGGLVGLKKPNNHSVPYSLTEEFVSVYRMHSLLPDYLDLRDILAAPGPNKSPPLSERIPMPNLIGHKGEQALADIGFSKQIVSMGHQASGALELWNYPLWLRDIIPQNVDGQDRPDHVDLPALEVYRDRERKVARYNEFRRALLLIPISKWEDLTDDDEAVRVLEEVYGHDVEELDLLVGLMAEKKTKGFAISQTAFVIFLIMASRRLEADRFFTSNFNEETYTKKGFEWVNNTESLKDVLCRHYPELVKKWMNSTSAFSIVHSADKFCKWHRFPVIIGLVYLLIRRHLYQKYNLFNVEPSVGVQFDPKDHPYRTVDGKYNDPSNANAGSVETLFGRNVLPVDQKDKVLKNQKDRVFLCWTI